MNDAVFQERYDRLNAAQKKAVDSIEGPVMVIAGPGTGKTTVLTLRIANILLKTDTPASSILALTFTEAGARNMKKRLFEIIGERAYEVRIHTFHSFASSVIAAHADHFVGLKDTSQLSEVEAEALVRSILKNPALADLRPLGNPDFYLSAILKSVSDMKREAVTPEMVKAFAGDEIKRIMSDETCRSTRGKTKGELKAEFKKEIEKCERTIAFAGAYERYEEEKRRQKKLDYDDLLIELLMALKRDELLLRLLQEQFLYILVDEHQDTNDSQNLVLELLADFFDTPNLFIVGDEKQAIYRFQGASVENFLRLKKKYPAMEEIALSDNYRSHSHILDGSFKMVKNNYSEADDFLPQPLSAAKKSEKRPMEIIYGDFPAVESDMIGKLKELAGKKETTAVITRTNREANEIFGLLERAGLSAVTEKKIDVLSHPLGLVYIALLKSVLDPADFESLSKTLSVGLWQAGSEAVFLIKALKRGDFKMAEKIPALKNLRQKLLAAGPAEFFIALAKESGFLEKAILSREGIDIYRAIVSLAQAAARETDSVDPRTVAERVILYAASNRTISINVASGSEEAKVKVMTAHASKGLEFDNVILPLATEESWLKRPSPSFFVLPKTAALENERDARRLFYVALTRAKKHVILYVPSESPEGDALLPVRFINEIGQDDAVSATLKALASIPELKPAADGFTLEMLERARRVLKEKGLSVTALNHFLECPNKFYFLSILKLPQAPSLSSEKGRAMHFAISAVWRQGAKSAAEIEKILKEKTAEYLLGSDLSLADREAVAAELQESAGPAAKALTAHFNGAGEIQTEIWVRSEFRFETASGEEFFPIHGQLDAVLVNGGTVNVFDYKTKKAMSVSAIKGETKSSDGNYFRQLVFYKLLLARAPEFQGKEIIPSLVFVAPDNRGNCPTVTVPVTADDIKALPIGELARSVWNGEFMKQGCGESDCEYCKLASLLPKEQAGPAYNLAEKNPA